MKLKELLIFCFSSFMIYSCSDDNDNPPSQTPNLEAEKQMNKVIDVLNEDAELSTFKEALANIDAKELAAKEFTILAYKNQVAPKATSSMADSIKKQETMRHIIGGHHTLEDLSKLKKIVALSKDTLYIDYSETEKSVSINGVLLGKSIAVDKSIIFVTDEIVPQILDTANVKEKEYVFRVMNINANWIPGETEGSGVVEGALVSIYDGDKVIKELRIGTDGIARFTYKEKNNLDYIVKTDTSSMIYEGYLVAGLFVSQEQADNAPVQEGEFRAIPGGLRFVDMNGDGIINSDDKIDRVELSKHSNNRVIYLVGKSYSFPKQEPEEIIDIDIAYDAYDEAVAVFEKLDSDYSTLTGRQTLSATSKIVDTLWNSSYDAIRKITTVIDYSTTDTSDRLELEGFRANLHFYLSLMFGDVPLQLADKTENIARNSQQEVYNFAMANYEKIFSHAAVSDKYKSIEYINSLLVYRLQKKYQGMYALAKEGLESGTILLRANNHSEPNAIRVHLLLAEAANELGMRIEAISYMNALLNADAKPSLGGNTTTDILRATIRNYYNGKDYEGYNLDYGIKYSNIVSWSINSIWGTYKLLPIPKSALTAFGNETLLTQNPGY